MMIFDPYANHDAGIYTKIYPKNYPVMKVHRASGYVKSPSFMGKSTVPMATFMGKYIPYMVRIWVMK